MGGRPEELKEKEGFAAAAARAVPNLERVSGRAVSDLERPAAGQAAFSDYRQLPYS